MPNSLLCGIVYIFESFLCPDVEGGRYMWHQIINPTYYVVFGLIFFTNHMYYSTPLGQALISLRAF